MQQVHVLILQELAEGNVDVSMLPSKKGQNLDAGHLGSEGQVSGLHPSFGKSKYSERPRR